MRAELIFFRLMILFSAIAFLAFASAAVYFYVRAAQMHDLGVSTSQQWTDLAAPCQDWLDKHDGTPKPPQCDLDYIHSLEDRWEHYFAERDSYLDAFDLSWPAALYVPAAFAFLFYSLRWAILGRIRPLCVTATHIPPGPTP